MTARDPLVCAYARIRRFVERERRMPTLRGMKQMIAQERKKSSRGTARDPERRPR